MRRDTQVRDPNRAALRQENVRRLEVSVEYSTLYVRRTNTIFRTAHGTQASLLIGFCLVSTGFFICWLFIVCFYF